MEYGLAIFRKNSPQNFTYTMSNTNRNQFHPPRQQWHAKKHPPPASESVQPTNGGIEQQQQRTVSAQKQHYGHKQRAFIPVGTSSSTGNLTPLSSSPSGTVAPISKRQRMRSECNGESTSSVDITTLQQPNNGNRARNNSNSGRGRLDNNNFAAPRLRQGRHCQQQRTGERGTGRMEWQSASNNNDSHKIALSVAVRSAELSDLPGFSYDLVTGKYYRILANTPGQPSGSTLHHLRNLAVRNGQQLGKNEHWRNEKLTQKSTPHLLNMLRQLQMGHTGPGAAQQFARRFAESRLRSVNQEPSYSFEVVDSLTGGRYASCQFLDVSEDGRTLLGCWSTEQCDRITGHCSRVLSFDVSVDAERGQRDAQRLDSAAPQLRSTDHRYASNTFGLRFEQVDNGICLDCLDFNNRILVDMALAPADRDVTCLLFATARSFFAPVGKAHCANNEWPSKLVTRCTVHLRPIEFNLSEEGRESMSSPIYNAEWSFAEPIWSLCFNSHHMKICVGMEKSAKIVNVLDGHDFYVTSAGRNVISCAFTKDGNALFLGRRCGDVSLLDLRLQSHHVVGELCGSTSSGFLHLLQHDRPHTLLTENFEGKIKLWDIRMYRRCLAEMEAGHRNSSHKLPCFVDAEERFVFAVGEDATVRGWSLRTGELICSVSSPVAHQRAARRRAGTMMEDLDSKGVDFPRVAYSASWGGKRGNSALIFAVNGDLLVHELTL